MGGIVAAIIVGVVLCFINPLLLLLWIAWLAFVCIIHFKKRGKK